MCPGNCQGWWSQTIGKGVRLLKLPRFPQLSDAGSCSLSKVITYMILFWSLGRRLSSIISFAISIFTPMLPYKESFLSHLETDRMSPAALSDHLEATFEDKIIFKVLSCSGREPEFLSKKSFWHNCAELEGVCLLCSTRWG